MALPRSQSAKQLRSMDLGASWRRIPAKRSRFKNYSKKARQVSSSSHTPRQTHQDVSRLSSNLPNDHSQMRQTLASLGGGLTLGKHCSRSLTAPPRHHPSMPLPRQLLPHHCGRPLRLRPKHRLTQIKHNLRHKAVASVPSAVRRLSHSHRRYRHEEGRQKYNSRSRRD